MKSLSYACAVCIFAGSQATHAAETAQSLSIDAIAADVIASNPERRFLANQITSASAGAAAAGRLADPELTVEFGEKRSSDIVSGARLGDGPAYSASIVQPIEFGGRIALRRAIAEGQVELARIGLRQFDATLSGRARAIAYALFAASEKADTAHIVASRLRSLQHVLVSRDPSGPAPALEAAVLEGGAITAEARAATAQGEFNALLYELNGLRGVPYASKIRITRPSALLPTLPSADVLAAQANVQNFELQSLRTQLAQQGLSVRLARKARFGTVAVGPYYSREQTNVFDRSVGVRVTMPLPIWNRQAGDVAAAQGRQAQADAALVAAERRIDRLVYQQASIYQARVEALGRWSGDTASRFERVANEADRNYRLGAVPLATYVEMQRQYLDAQTAILDARRDAVDAAAQLRALTGGSDRP